MKLTKTLNCGAVLNVEKESSTRGFLVRVTGTRGQVGAGIEQEQGKAAVTLHMYISAESLVQIRDIIDQLNAPMPPKITVSEQLEAELEPRPWDGNTIGDVLKHGRE